MMSASSSPTIADRLRSHPLVMVIAVTLLAWAALLAAMALLGNATPAPIYDLAPDPAGVALPF